MINRSRSAPSPRTSCTRTSGTRTCTTRSAAAVARSIDRLDTSHKRIRFLLPLAKVTTHRDLPYRLCIVFQLVVCAFPLDTRTSTGTFPATDCQSTCVRAAVVTRSPSCLYLNIISFLCSSVAGWVVLILLTGLRLPPTCTARVQHRGTRPDTQRSPTALRHCRSALLTSLLCTAALSFSFHTRTGMSIQAPTPPCRAANSCHGKWPPGLRPFAQDPVSSCCSQCLIPRSCCCLRVSAGPWCCPQ